MVLSIDGNKTNSKQQTLLDFLDHQVIREQVSDFLDKPFRKIDAPINSLHIFQGEYLTTPASQERIVGSTDATTCAITVLHCCTTGLCTVAHHDEYTAENNRNIDAILHGMQHPRLYMLGAFADSKNIGYRVANNLFKAFQQHAISIDVQLLCVYTLNTHPVTNAPICQSLSYNTSTLEIEPVARWNYSRGPLEEARMAQLWYGSSKSLSPITIDEDGFCTITISVGRLPESYIEVLEEYVALEDTALLQKCSTSPEYELPHIATGKRLFLVFKIGRHYINVTSLKTTKFVLNADIRNALKWILKQHGIIERKQFKYKWSEEHGRWEEQ